MRAPSMLKLACTLVKRCAAAVHKSPPPVAERNGPKCAAGLTTISALAMWLCTDAWEHAAALTIRKHLTLTGVTGCSEGPACNTNWR